MNFHPIDLKGKHKGFVGLFKLFRELRSEKFDFFLDWHDVLRSKVMRSFFVYTNTKVIAIQKDRKTKEAIVNKKAKLSQQKHSIERYLETARKAFLKTNPNYRFVLPTDRTRKNLTIGIAPFAAHDSKEWGIEKLEELLDLYSKEENVEILLFGGGSREEALLNKLEQKYLFCKSIAGKYNLKQELELIAECKVFIAMDSGNMHIASLMGVPTISIWFSTHPFLGFAPWGNEHLCVQPSQSELPCRPVSVYGKIRDEEAANCVNKARNLIKPEIVFEKSLKVLNAQ
jgi:ADP-heptose:LPS heptosyltransferase